ncbi:hypothetical protein B0H17DRAFT_1202008 [Mycena rosella]|uniref:Uncharacterized protein n=1 Tax=Mycena rosella TaxID=1033263 RepID=A0AAD7GGP9_MYCRO|nr:hypothetical protein B0H17DRAFT_1202008 [Mycena rosella]
MSAGPRTFQEVCNPLKKKCPSWNDTIRASLAACVPCLAQPSSSADSDTENPPNLGDYVIRRARADELEGLADAT